MAEMQGKPEMALLLVGRTGNGKSSTGNTILQNAHLCTDVTGKEKTKSKTKTFNVAHSLISDTQNLESAVCQRGDQKITVLNTPDLETMESSVEKKIMELEAWHSQIKDKNHAVLLIIRCNKRYTEQEYAVYKRINVFKKFNNNLIVVFTMGGDLNGRDLRTDIMGASSELQQVLDDAGWRYVVFDNKPLEDDATIKAACVRTLFEIVDTKTPHPFPQQVCRLLVTGQTEDQIQKVVKTLPDGTRSRVSKGPVRYLVGTTSQGYRLEVTVCTNKDLTLHSEAVRLSLCPGPHAILRVSGNSPNTTDLQTALGTQGELPIKSSNGLIQLNVNDFVIDLVLDESQKNQNEGNVGNKGRVLYLDIRKPQESFGSILKLVQEVARSVFYLTAEMKRSSEVVQKQINDTQAAYSRYIDVKSKMINEFLGSR